MEWGLVEIVFTAIAGAIVLIELCMMCCFMNARRKQPVRVNYYFHLPSHAYLSYYHFIDHYYVDMI
jgi:hypothetical protein